MASELKKLSPAIGYYQSPEQVSDCMDTEDMLRTWTAAIKSWAGSSSGCIGGKEGKNLVSCLSFSLLVNERKPVCLRWWSGPRQRLRHAAGQRAVFPRHGGVRP